MKRLQYEMVKNGFTSEKLAKSIDVTRQSIYHWLSGKTSISINSMCKLHSLGFDIKSLENPTEEI